jgi:radical SAM-linked protein
VPQTTRVDSELRAPTPEPRQRWRIVFARAADAPESLTPSSPGLDAFETSLAAAGIAVARAGKRAKLSLAAPLPAGVAGERELADLFLLDRHAIEAVRLAIDAALPAGHRLVGLHDVWLGEPALPGQVAAADYRIVLEPSAPDPGLLAAACERLLAATSLPRDRPKGDRTVTYDLRPLLADLRTDPNNALPAISFRTRIDPERGAGRPDEVLAAVAAAAGSALAPASTTRTWIWLAGDGEPGPLAT